MASVEQWCQIKERILELAGLDKTLQCFGARTHRYQFGNHLSEDNIERWEAQQGYRLPDALRNFYLACGNGGAGPYHGVSPLEKLRGYRPAESYPGALSLMNIARAKFDPNDDACLYEFENERSWCVPEEDLTGLLCCIDYGCGVELCLRTGDGDNCEVTWNDLVNDRGLRDGGLFIDEFENWLEAEISRFATIQRLLAECESFASFQEMFSLSHNNESGIDRMVSFLGAHKPAELFGPNENRFHGASQFPWYEQQFNREKSRQKPWLHKFVSRMR